MSHRRYGAALFMGLFTLQLWLAGVSAACSMGEHAPLVEGADAPAAGSGDMMMPGMAMGAHESAAASGSDELPADEVPCEHPASTQQCRLMAPCSSGYVAPLATAAAQAASAPVLAYEAPVLHPPSRSSAPEPPPPKA